MTAAVPLRVAIVGCGAVVEQFHAPALEVLSARGDIEVVALCDPAAAPLEAAARKFRRAARVTALADVVRARPDFALIASPPAMHAAQAIALLDAGIHVLCEKPFVPSAADAGEVIAAARRSQRVLAVGLCRRFVPATRRIRDAIVSGELGALRSASVTEVGGLYWPFRSTSAFTPGLTPGGVLLDIGTHALDLLAWWFPQIRVAGYQDDAMGGVEATAVVTLQIDDAPATVRLSRDWPIPSRYDLSFERGRIVWEWLDPVAVRIDGLRSAADEDLASTESQPSSWPEAFVLQLSDIARAIRGNTAPTVGGEDAIAALRLIEESYRVRTLLVSPWFSAAEQAAAIEAAQPVAC